MITVRLYNSHRTTIERTVSIQGVVFDMDGLLLDTERLYCKLFQELVSEQGRTLSDEGYRRMVGHRIDISKRVLAEEIGATEPVDAIFAELEARYYDYIAHREVPIRPGARELIDALRRHGVPLALCTSTYRRLTVAKLRNTGLLEVFAVIVCGDEVSRGKPYPDPYVKAVAGLGLLPQQALALEDSPTGLAAAHSAGLHTILVPDLVRAQAESLAAADAVADSLHTVRQWLSAAKPRSAEQHKTPEPHTVPESHKTPEPRAVPEPFKTPESHTIPEPHKAAESRETPEAHTTADNPQEYPIA